ncbi:MAG: CAP domain-containing protein [Caldilineaceae bacterium]
MKDQQPYVNRAVQWLLICILALASAGVRPTQVHADPTVGAHQVFLPVVKVPEAIAAAPQCGLNEQEQIIETLAISHSGQQRASMSCNPILAAVARARAEDMGRRAYFGHVNPDGHGPNYLVQIAGYVLPSFYGQEPTSNNIESIGAGPNTAQVMFDAWMGSSKHRTHILAENEFYRPQIEYGIGFAEVPGSPYTYYWVFISAYAGP